MTVETPRFRAVLVHDFNSGNPRRWLEWHELAAPLREHPWLPPDSAYIGSTLLALAEALGPQAPAFRVLVSWWFGSEPILPYVGDDVIVFCLGDGFARKPSYSHDVRLVAKTHGVTRRPSLSLGDPPTWPALLPTLLQETRAQWIRLPAALRSMARTARRGRRATFVEIPLGTYLLSEVPFVSFDSRIYDISFAGSVRNDGEERRRVLPRKTRSRRRMMQTLEDLQADHPAIRVGIKAFDVFGQAREHEAGYSERMMQTRLAPCPRGGYLETYRLFEAAASGCVPIVEGLPHRPYYKDCPAIQIRSWTQLFRLAPSLLADRDQLRLRHEAVLKWWKTRCSAEATAARIAEALDRPAVDARLSSG